MNRLLRVTVNTVSFSTCNAIVFFYTFYFTLFYNGLHTSKPRDFSTNNTDNHFIEYKNTVVLVRLPKVDSPKRFYRQINFIYIYIYTIFSLDLGHKYINVTDSKSKIRIILVQLSFIRFWTDRVIDGCLRKSRTPTSVMCPLLFLFHRQLVVGRETGAKETRRRIRVRPKTTRKIKGVTQKTPRPIEQRTSRWRHNEKNEKSR